MWRQTVHLENPCALESLFLCYLLLWTPAACRWWRRCEWLNKTGCHLIQAQQGIPGGIGVLFTGRGHQPSTPETNFPCSETRPCRISKPSVSKGKQKCCYLLHNTDVLIRALISSEGKLKSGDMYKTHTLSHTHTKVKYNQTGSASRNQEKNNCRNSVKSAHTEISWLCFVSELMGCVESFLHPNIAIVCQLRCAAQGQSSPGCHLILFQTITWLNGNILIMQ